jgi:hypothetical protein
MFLQYLKPTHKIQRNSHNKKFQTFGNTVLCAGLSMTLLTCSFATFKAIYPLFISSLNAATTTSFQSTSIPWLQDKSSCQHSGRSWHKGKCWDDEHSPHF